MTASSTLVDLVQPAYFTHPDYHDTHGPEVTELLEEAGFAPDPEQRMLLDLIFAFDKAGELVADDVVVIAPRQNLKTGLFKQAAIGKVFYLERPLFVWSAHEFSTTQEAFRELQIIIESTPTLDRQVKHIHQAAGSEAIELLGGQRIKFKARTKSGGRGLSGDDVLLDEGFALQRVHMGSLQPTMAARPQSQMMIGSSAGKAESEVLRGFRDRGRVGSSRLVYAEWMIKKKCADDRCTHEVLEPGCVLDDLRELRNSNPALDRRIPARKLLSFRQSMHPAEFGREFGGWWDEADSDSPAIGQALWRSAESHAKTLVEVAGFGVAVDPDRAWAAIGAAGVHCECIPPFARCEEGLTDVELLPDDHRRGTDWVVARCIELNEAHRPGVFVIDGGGPAASLIPEMQAAGLPLLVANTKDVAAAYGLFMDALTNRTLRHGPQEQLEAAVRVAKTRPCGDGGQAFGRRVSGADITPLEAVNLAHWAAVTRPKVNILQTIW